jgi:thiamine monophosphate synthase
VTRPPTRGGFAHSPLLSGPENQQRVRKFEMPGVTLPPLLLLTDRSQLPPGRRLTDVVAAAVRGGVRAVLLRERDLLPSERGQLAEELRAVLDPVLGLLLSASPIVRPAAGVHLRAGEPKPSARAAFVGRSCHDAAELAAALDERSDYVTLSPVAASASKPGYGPALGADRFGALVARTPLRVYALGGVTPANAATWIDAGAYGIAVMGSVMRADDPTEVAAAHLDAMGAAAL